MKQDDFIPILMPVFKHAEILKNILTLFQNSTKINETILIISQTGNDSEVFNLIKA